MPMMPNRYGVFSNSAKAVNQQADTMKRNPKPDAEGNYGFDPITTAPIRDATVAKQLADPNSGQSRTMSESLWRASQEPEEDPAATSPFKRLRRRRVGMM